MTLYVSNHGETYGFPSIEEGIIDLYQQFIPREGHGLLQRIVSASLRYNADFVRGNATERSAWELHNMKMEFYDFCRATRSHLDRNILDDLSRTYSWFSRMESKSCDSIHRILYPDDERYRRATHFIVNYHEGKRVRAHIEIDDKKIRSKVSRMIYNAGIISLYTTIHVGISCFKTRPDPTPEQLAIAHAEYASEMADYLLQHAD